MFNNIFEHKYLKEPTIVDVIGLNKKIQTEYVWNLFNVSKKSILVVTSSLYEANKLYKSLTFYNDLDVLLFPMDDFLASEAVAASPDLMFKRIEVLNTLSKSDEKKIIITNCDGYLRFLPAKKLWKTLPFKITVNSSFSRESIIKKLDMLGYKRQTLVTKTGEYAARGYILDIYPYAYDEPCRIEFFDDQIEDIRFFDTTSQLSKGSVSEIKIDPLSEFVNEKQVNDISEKQSMLPFVVNEVSSISKYIEDFITVYSDLEEIKLSYKKTLEDIFEFSKDAEVKQEKYMQDLNDIIPDDYINLVSTDNYLTQNTCEVYSTKEIDVFAGNFELINNFLTKCLNNNKKVIVCLDNDKMINDFTSKIDVPYILTNDKQLFGNKINIIKYKLLNGFIIGQNIFLSTSEIYKRNIIIKYKNNFRYGVKINDINNLKLGDYIVHQAFGIGRYLGIVTLESRGLKKDYIYLEYLNNDKLYIPVENVEYISKYSSGDGVKPKLNKLGGTDWVKQKARVKSRVKDIANELIALAAKRKIAKGFAFYPDDERQYEFEDAFLHQETPDQIKVIRQIKEDMEKPYPMDRLLCGDVGFGKTEVAFRAIFKAIESGKQAAFLCPTTILSNQHYENAKSRFDGFGINIEVLNRFITQKKKNEILQNLKTGKIDLIIGTHRLLSKDIIYKDLGLLVIDEEQRFGVTHKEKIKEYSQNIDVLTLSATPIPRTLQMSLSGIRGLSLIETPPLFRYPIQTYVLKENKQIIKDAIYKELARDGQVFILYNNVKKMNEKLLEIEKLVPGVKVAFVHGQMNKDQIETTMESFVDKKYDVLLCSTIIETGIDIQNANTLIVYDADCFGLSQLYQIRGRIGRGKNIAYAYLMYKTGKELNEDAQKRLNAIKEFTELGSGYSLAIRDLSIRGAGDILGSEQSGFIDAVGYDMYLKILNEEIQKIQSGAAEVSEEKEVEKPFVQVNTHISEKYTQNENLKIYMHKKINEINSYESFLSIKKELEDKFGKLDEEIIVYMLEELFQALAKEKGVFKVIQNERKITVLFSKEKTETLNAVYLLSKLFEITKAFNVRYINRLLEISLDLNQIEKHFIYYLVKMIDIIE